MQQVQYLKTFMTQQRLTCCD